jgi:hypothetical protein
MSAARAQILEFREVGGKSIQCLHTGLTSDLKDCGFKSEWYAYVFVGSISAITSSDKEEKKLEIMPDEIFHGEPPSPLTILTSQGACLPTLAVGDRWLFFLRKENGKPIVLDYYGNDSLPVADAQAQIETLRRLKTIGDLGILRGRVTRGISFEGKAVPNANVVAHELSDGTRFVTTTDADGRYEFQPLPPGKYKVKVDPIASFQPDDSEIEVNRGGCWDLSLSKYPHARLQGHVQHSDGSPTPGMGVILASEDGSSWSISNADAHGHFHFDSLRPGKYVLGVHLPTAPPWKYGGAGGGGNPPNASLYYPGVPNRAAALIVTLADDEKRDDIDLVVPTQ